MTDIATATIMALAAIDAELGLPEDGCNSTVRTLTAIRLLHSVHRDDVTEIERLERELAEAREERYPPIPPNGSAARSLGAYLADVLCEDQWARAEEMLLGIHAAYVALCAENEALRTDVERYRWLRDCCSEDAVILRGAALDAAIDAAKERTP